MPLLPLGPDGVKGSWLPAGGKGRKVCILRKILRHLFRRKSNLFVISELKIFLKRLRAFRFNLPLAVLLCWCAVAALADFLANDKPIYAVVQNEGYFPAADDYAALFGFSFLPAELRNADWKSLKLANSVWPPVAFRPENQDLFAQYLPPFSAEGAKLGHFFGTDGLGRDTLSGLIHGARISLGVGLGAAAMAGAIGALLGGLAGYFGNDRLRARRGYLLPIPLAAIIWYFYAWQAPKYLWGEGLKGNAWAFISGLTALLAATALAAGLVWGIGKMLSRFPYGRKIVRFPLDDLISRFLEIWLSLPAYLLIITLSAVLEPGADVLVIIIGLTAWTTVARLSRAELLRVRALDYIAAARAQGQSFWRVMRRHALPNASGPVFVALAFVAAASIMIESSLSFLGMGVSAETVTWGLMLNLGRLNPQAWWLAVFPGLAVFSAVISFHALGRKLEKAWAGR